MQSASMSHFPELVRVRVPRGLPEALAMGASARNTSPAEYARQALLAMLAQDGVRLRDGRVEATQDGASARWMRTRSHAT
jgi:hypothetical protein